MISERDDQYIPVPVYLPEAWPIRDLSALTESDTRQSHQTSIAENPMLPAVFHYSEFNRFASSTATFLNVELITSILKSFAIISNISS